MLYFVALFYVERIFVFLFVLEKEIRNRKIKKTLVKTEGKVKKVREF